MDEFNDNKIANEVAVEEVNKWLKFKAVRKSTIESSKTAINSLVGAVEEGILELNEDFSWKHNLINPIVTEDSSTNFLNYKPRMYAMDIQTAMRGNSAGDSMAVMMAIASELTGVNRSIIKKLEIEDYGITQNIALFFVPK